MIDSVPLELWFQTTEASYETEPIST